MDSSFAFNFKDVAFFATLKPGLFLGNPVVEWLGMHKGSVHWKLISQIEYIPANPILKPWTARPGEITNGGSTPRWAHILEDFDPWRFAKSYIIHDSIWSAHHRGVETPTFHESNLMLAESVYTEMVAENDVNHMVLMSIFTAVESNYGRQIWDGKE